MGKILLLITAFIWGSTFVAQRIATEFIGPASYNAIRFLFGTLVLLPIIKLLPEVRPVKKPHLPFWLACAVLGFCLAAGTFLQQYAIEFTTSAKASFITALYIVWVPIGGLFIGQRLSYLAISGVFFTVLGAACLTLFTGTIGSITPADGALLFSTFIWMAHILCLTDFTQRYPLYRLALGQFIFCALFSFIPSFLFENLSLLAIENALLPLLWGGILSVGVGFTLQLIGQKTVPPTEASLIMSLEMVFAGLTGYLILNEHLSFMEVIGVICISIGVILAQLPSPEKYSIPPLRNSID